MQFSLPPPPPQMSVQKYNENRSTPSNTFHYKTNQYFFMV